MIVVVVRHGHAVDEARGLGDEGRYLSGKGRRQTRAIAKWLTKKKRAKLSALWTSPLVRAVQTAEIVAGAFGLEERVTAIPELMPGRDPGDLLKRLGEVSAREDAVVGLVGHEPQLGHLASKLLGKGFAGFAKSGALAVRWDGEKGEQLFYKVPSKKGA